MEIECFLAEGHIHKCRAHGLNMAFGQLYRIAHNPWGVAPGYGEKMAFRQRNAVRAQFRNASARDMPRPHGYQKQRLLADEHAIHCVARVETALPNVCHLRTLKTGGVNSSRGLTSYDSFVSVLNSARISKSGWVMRTL